MRHLSADNLITYIDGRTLAVEKPVVEQHLSVCGECAGLWQELQNLVSHLQEDSAYEPPPEVLQWGVALFQPVMQSASEGKVRKIIAALVFDTFEQPALANVRRVGAPPRQLLFRAGDVDVDVKIDSIKANDRITLVGQVLSNRS